MSTTDSARYLSGYHLGTTILVGTKPYRVDGVEHFERGGDHWVRITVPRDNDPASEILVLHASDTITIESENEEMHRARRGLPPTLDAIAKQAEDVLARAKDDNALASLGYQLALRQIVDGIIGWQVERDREQADLLTEDEHAVMDLSGALWNAFCKIVGHGRSRDHDCAEVAAHVHGIQHAVLAQAAARAYPERYRLLGGSLAPAEAPGMPLPEPVPGEVPQSWLIGYWRTGPGSDHERFRRDMDAVRQAQSEQAPGPRLEGQTEPPVYMTEPDGPGFTMTMTGREVEVRIESGVPWVRSRWPSGSWTRWARMQEAEGRG